MAKQKQVFNGNCPKNARIKIDYEAAKNGKAEVEFIYPDKKNQVTGSVFPAIFFFWILLFALYSYIAQITDLDIAYSKTTLQLWTECMATDSIQTLTNYTGAAGLCHKAVPAVFSTKHVLSIFAIVFLPPLIIYFPFRKRWNKLYPKWQSLLSRKKYMFFNSKSPFKDSKLKYFEVPYFANVNLSYKASKDFSKHLRFIEIHEYPFFTHKELKFRPWKKKNRKKHPPKNRYTKVNEFVWYARFYYKEKPVNGKLEVWFA